MTEKLAEREKYLNRLRSSTSQRASPNHRSGQPLQLDAEGFERKVVFKYSLSSSPVVLDTPPEVFLWYYTEDGRNFGWNLAVPSWGISFSLTEYHETSPRSKLINED